MRNVLVHRASALIPTLRSPTLKLIARLVGSIKLNVASIAELGHNSRLRYIQVLNTGGGYEYYRLKLHSYVPHPRCQIVKQAKRRPVVIMINFLPN